MSKIVSEQYFRFDSSDYAKNLRQIYGEDGYKKYTAKLNSVITKGKTFTNPIAKSKAEYISEKEIQYKQALANLSKSRNIWNRYKSNYRANLDATSKQNNGISISSQQRQAALEGAGGGAVKAYNNFNNAQAEADYALSLYNDATHDGMPLNLMG